MSKQFEQIKDRKHFLRGDRKIFRTLRKILDGGTVL